MSICRVQGRLRGRQRSPHEGASREEPSYVDDALGNVAKRRGIRKAIVALGRRLAVLMHRIWSDGTEFRWTKDPLMQPSI
jgi:hypothetical protein